MKLIVAVDACWAIGKDGDQLCYIPPDLKRFQRLTTGHPVLLGRKTLATFPGGRPLKNRRNLILSTDPAFAPAGGEVFATLKAALAAAPADTFVIGGSRIPSIHTASKAANIMKTATSKERLILSSVGLRLFSTVATFIVSGMVMSPLPLPIKGKNMAMYSMIVN